MLNHRDKGSVTLALILITIFFTFLLFVPLPHYHHESYWFMGPSIAARIIDNTTEAAPLDQVVGSYVNATLQSPFDISCSTDIDCKVINIETQCKSYCADSASNNPEVIESLKKQRVCDPAFWRPEKFDCRCVFNKCIKINY